MDRNCNKSTCAVWGVAALKPSTSKRNSNFGSLSQFFQTGQNWTHFELSFAEKSSSRKEAENIRDGIDHGVSDRHASYLR
jgi:hypothetical protein